MTTNHSIRPRIKLKETQLQHVETIAPVIVQVNRPHDEDPVFKLRWWTMLGEYVVEASVEIVNSGMDYELSAPEFRYNGVPIVSSDRCIEWLGHEWPCVIWHFPQTEDWHKCILENTGVYTTQRRKP